MDITEKSVVTCVEWFHGYGGNAIGLKRAIPGLRSVAVCEREAFVVANMVSKMEAGLMDPVPVWSDVTTFPIEPFKDRVGLFIASYPCQPFSHAGKRDGHNDERHLWPSCRRFICGAHPSMVFLENVEGHVTLGLSTVLADLEEDGYTAAWGIFSAAEVGAPHQRKRVFILAYDRLQRQEKPELKTAGAFKCGEELAIRDSIRHTHREPSLLSTETGVNAQRDPATSGGEIREDVAHHHHQRLQGLRERGGQTGREDADGHFGGDSQVWPSRPGERQYAWEPPRVSRGGVGHRNSKGQRDTEGEGLRGEEGKPTRHIMQSVDVGRGLCQTQPPMGGNADGSAPRLDFPRCTGLSDTELEEIYGWMVKGTNRTDELRMCGNGVVPQTAERAFRVLYEELSRPAGTNNTILGDNNAL